MKNLSQTHAQKKIINFLGILLNYIKLSNIIIIKFIIIYHVKKNEMKIIIESNLKNN